MTKNKQASEPMYVRYEQTGGFLWQEANEAIRQFGVFKHRARKGVSHIKLTTSNGLYGSSPVMLVERSYGSLMPGYTPEQRLWKVYALDANGQRSNEYLAVVTAESQIIPAVFDYLQRVGLKLGAFAHTELQIINKMARHG